MTGIRRLTGHCQCGAIQLVISGRPLLRAYCHCLICQEFNQADFADVTVFRARDVSIPNEERIRYRVYKQPPIVRRGTCAACGKPAAERLAVPLMPRMTVVPSSNLIEHEGLPSPAMHIFYHRRKAEATDSLPKYSGFLTSQSRFTLALALALVKG
ncbi:hypothetical protein BurJ1DRAFT_1853 [Burkholderiales bacterium JOSHI_001]|nr:hypothetical protein BurJ1DRAFT_1853 [Burkholderiales bacterium JOSHI_001]